MQLHKNSIYKNRIVEINNEVQMGHLITYPFELIFLRFFGQIIAIAIH